jgi:hypothetical protein
VNPHALALAFLIGLASGGGGGWWLARLLAEHHQLQVERDSNQAAFRAIERADAAELRFTEERARHADTNRQMQAALRWATGRDCIAAPAAERLRDAGAAFNGLPDPAGPAGRPGPDPRAATDGDAIDLVVRLTAYAGACRDQVNEIRAAVSGKPDPPAVGHGDIPQGNPQ